MGPLNPVVFARRTLVSVLSLQLAFPMQLNAATLDLTQVPLAKASSAVVPPNLMFILDDSGSMAWDYLPDYVDDRRTCFDSGDRNTTDNNSDNYNETSGNIEGTRDECSIGDVPYMSPDFNFAYYNPDVLYDPGVNADGSSKGNQSITSAETDPYGVQESDQLGNGVTSVDLTTSYPERVFCDATGATATDTAHCKQNKGLYDSLGTDYVFPNADFPYGRSGTAHNSGYKLISGAPYYYRLDTKKYCSDAALTTCINATAASAPYIFPAKNRFCKEPASAGTALTDCRAKYDSAAGYIVPEHTGYVVPATGSPTQSYGTINITSATGGYSITDITVDGVSIISSTYTAPSGATPATVATDLRNLINTSTSTPEYRACVGTWNGTNSCTGSPTSLVTLLPQTTTGGSTGLTGTAPNGFVIAVTGSATTGGTQAQGTITIGNSGSDASISISSVTVDGFTISNSAATAGGGTNTATEQNNLATLLASKITLGGYTATASGNVVTIFAPLGVASASAPVIVQSPAPGSGGTNASATLTFSITGSNQWSIRSVRIRNGGLCTYSDTQILSGTTNDSNNATTVAGRVRGADANGDNILIGGTGNQAIISGTGSLTGGTLAGCVVDVEVDKTNTGSSSFITINSSSTNNNAATVLSNVAEFVGGGGGLPTIASATGISGGVLPSGTIATSATNFANGSLASPATRQAVGAFKRCDITASADCAGLGVGKFPKHSDRVDCTNAGYCTYDEEATNFANWYSYYRTRMQAMKSAAGLAFAGIGSDYRVGFMTIKANSSNAGSEYLRIDKFDSVSQKPTWYSRFYGTVPGSGTPLRSALSKAGRIFAGKNPLGLSSSDDPVQYSCQQNFSILTTDGYWNTDALTDVKKVDGTTIDNPDGATGVARPYFDGAQASTTCGTMTSTARSCGTLADVAYHYYNTDIRDPSLSNCTGTPVGAGPALDVCANNVAGAGEDNLATQHMTTYTLGLGLDGSLNYTEDYKTAATGDYADILAGTKNWPAVRQDSQLAIDDLWHAAVNGRGQYFSARSPATLTRQLTDTLTGIKVSLGAGAAAATSNLEPTEGDNFSYVASYTTQYWYGNLEARTIALTTAGTVQAGTTGEQAIWCVEDVAARADVGTTACTGTLKSKVAGSTDTRSIYLFDSATANKLRSFQWTNLTPAEQGYFDPTTLSQYATLGLVEKAAATGDSLIRYLRGQTQHEDDASNLLRIYRDRRGTLGDAVGSQPVYVGRPGFGYTDKGYAGYKTTKSTRAGTVYIGTNDGMLHAFNSVDGTERWAYVPKASLPNMKNLADNTYANNHRFFVDGSPTVADVCTANCDNDVTAVWATVLVGGYGGGGKGYYALDITDPTAPKALWELGPSDDANFGYSFGQALVTKRNDGKWVALLTSGYNNVGDGTGYLYVVDIADGTILDKISTGVGNATTPSGLAKIENFVVNASEDNTTNYVYGGDLLGNVWRFQIDKDATTVVKVAEVRSGTGTTQPITTRPIVTTLDGVEATRYIAIATGQLLEQDDLTDTSPQSVYGFVDEVDTTGVAVGLCVGCTNGAREQLIEKELENGLPDAQGRPTRRTSAISIPATKVPAVQGCFIDLPLTGERVNVDMKLTLGNLAVISNVPKADACSAGGESYVTFINYKTCEVDTSYKIGDALAVGMVILKVPSGFVVSATLSNNPTPTLVGSVPPPPGAVGFQGRRVGWRLLFD